MDTVNQLAVDLSAAHPLLASRWGWTRILARAADGSNGDLATLAGTVFADRALGAVATLREAREHGIVQSEACATGGATAMQPGSVHGHASPEALPLVWSGPDVVIGVDELAHAPTIRPSIAAREMCSR